MFYIVGLGNPGTEYKNTRHNVGFLLCESLVEKLHFSTLFSSAKYSGRLSEGEIYGKEVSILLPDTFMNASGSAVAKLVPKNESQNLVVVYDDIDIPFGEIKVSYGRGDGGHNGIKSIVTSLGTKDFLRIRVGIAQKSIWTGEPKRPKGKALASFVLRTFSAKELKVLDEVCTTFETMMKTLMTDGKEKVMNTFN